MPPKTKMIEFDMDYPDRGVVFRVQVRYNESNWWAVMGLRRARNIKVVTK